jgi:hypothetical protein
MLRRRVTNKFHFPGDREPRLIRGREEGNLVS